MLKIGGLVVVCLTALGVTAMITGNDGSLLNNIVIYIAGLGTGVFAEVAERIVTKE